MMTLRDGRFAALALGTALFALAGLPAVAVAQAEIHGFVEGAYGVRTAESSVHDGTQDFTMQESRAQLRLTAYGDVGEGFIRLDLLNDHLVDDGTTVELREGFLRFTTLSNKLDVKVGRQALTWGTGDLVFVNDLFPKDWNSFFAGREDQYLKAPSDAVRLAFYGLPFDVDFVVTPEYTSDRLPMPGGRFSVEAPEGAGMPLEPALTAENAELALKLSRYVGNFTAAFYGYRGFYKTFEAVQANPAFDPAAPLDANGDPVAAFYPYHPELTVYGASLRGPVPGGIGWLEGGWYDSREDPDGDNPMIENSSLRYLAGYEKQVWSDFNMTLQYFGEMMIDHDAYVTSLGGAPAGDEFRHLITMRAEQYLHYQLIRLSLFTFYSPTDEDAHIRLLTSYKVSDDVEVVLGANLFEGDSKETMFGAFDEDDSIYTRLRYSF